jgi:uncharacterized surface protein with fasciclin (FAS1) repeats
MNWRAVWCAVAVTAGASGVAVAQEVDSAGAAVGIYRPVPPTDTVSPRGDSPDSIAADPLAGDTLLRRNPPDTLAARPGADSLADTTRADTASADSLPRADTSARIRNALQPAEEREGYDTSLTARMDAKRGGGLRRAEFPDLLNTAKMTGSYHTFIGLVDRSSFARLLTGKAAVTLLAPTDSAFARLPSKELTRLRSNAAARDAWLGTLIFNGDLKSADLVKASKVRSRGGTLVHFSSGDSGVRAGQARLVRPDLVARNGILHGLDRVTLSKPTSATP